MSGTELIAIARQERPGVRYLLSKDGKSIGAWSESLQRTVVVAAQDLQGRWVSLPYELLINGQPVQPEWEGA